MAKNGGKPRRLIIARRSARSTDSPLRLGEILFVDLEPDELSDAAFARGDRGISNAEKWIEHYHILSKPVQPNAVFRQRDWKRCRMRPFLGAALDRFVRNEPGIAAATSIPSVRVTPSRNVTLVGVWHAERETIDWSFPFGREMENVFLAIVEIARRTDR